MRHYFGKICFFVLFFIQTIKSTEISAQNISTSNLSNIVKRIYNIEKFEGIRFFEDNEGKYLLISVKLEKKNLSENTLNTLANVRAKAELNKFQNGSYINSELIIISSNDSIIKNPISTEQIKEYSAGFVKGLISLSILKEESTNSYIYFYCVKI